MSLLSSDAIMYHVITDEPVWYSKYEQEFTCRRTCRALDMSVTLFTDDIVGSDGPVYTCHTVSGPGCPQSESQINIKVGHVV